MNQERTRLVLDIDADGVERLKTWQPCTRLRLVQAQDGSATLEVDTRELCAHCRGTGAYHRQGICMRCKYCRGTGLR